MTEPCPPDGYQQGVHVVGGEAEHLVEGFDGLVVALQGQARLGHGAVGLMAVMGIADHGAARHHATAGGDALKDAEQQKAAIGFQVLARGARLVKHGLHCQVAPAKLGGPDLLPLEG